MKSLLICALAGFAAVGFADSTKTFLEVKGAKQGTFPGVTSGIARGHKGWIPVTGFTTSSTRSRAAVKVQQFIVTLGADDLEQFQIAMKNTEALTQVHLDVWTGDSTNLFKHTQAIDLIQPSIATVKVTMAGGKQVQTIIFNCTSINYSKP